jgi:two-component system NtrC family sensor kinase
MTSSIAIRHLDAAIATTGGALFAVDGAGVVREWPRSAEELFGRAAQEAIGRPAPRAAGGARDRLAAALEAALRGEVATLEGIFVEGRGGARLRVTATVVPVALAGSGAVAAVVVRPEQVVREAADAERRLGEVLDAIPAPIFFKDADGVYQGCNSAFEDLLGKRRDEILGSCVEDVAPPHLAAIYREADLRLMRDGKTQVYETRVRGGDGGERHVLFAKAVLRDTSGAVEGLVGTMLDISARKRAEEAVRASEERLQLVLQSVGEIFWEWDVPLGTFRVASNAAEVLGVPAAELSTARALIRRTHEADRRALARVPERHTVELDHRVLSARGEWRWVHTRARVVSRDAAGRPQRVVGASADVTEHKQLESELHLADRLASLGSLAAGIAHEINNPLSYVLANAQFALDELGGGAAAAPASLEEVVEALRAACDGAERVAAIVRDLKVLSRADDEAVGPVRLRAVVDSAATLVRNEIRDRATLSVDVPEDLRVRGNAQRLGQVVINLLVNAAQAIDPGAPQRNRVSVAARARGPEVVIEVSDTGCGISADGLPRIFDPFYTTKPPGVGTGLGLTISHRLVSSLGGRIEVDSARGKGSTFSIVLPAAGAREPVE